MGEFQSGTEIYSHRKSGILKLEIGLYHCKAKCMALEGIQSGIALEPKVMKKNQGLHTGVMEMQVGKTAPIAVQYWESTNVSVDSVVVI